MKKLIIAILVLLSLQSYSQIEIRGTAIYFKNLNDATTHYITSVDDAWLVTGNTTIMGDATIAMGIHGVSFTATDGAFSVSIEKVADDTKSSFSQSNGGISFAWSDIAESNYANINTNSSGVLIALSAGKTFSGSVSDSTSYVDASYPSKYYVLQHIANASGGGGSGMTIGSAISGSTAGRALYVGTGGILQNDANYKYDSTNKILDVESIDLGSHFNDVNVLNSGYSNKTYLLAYGTGGGAAHVFTIASGGTIGHGDFLPGSTTQYEMRIPTASHVGLWVKGASSQTGELAIFGDNLGNAFASILASGKMAFNSTITAGGTTGNQTINKPTGTVNIAAAGTNVTVTNSLVTTSSIVYAIVRTNDATATGIKNIVPGSGSFVITLNAAATAEVSIGFIVFN